MSGYAFHPEASADLDEIWEYIAVHDLDAADSLIDDIADALALLAANPAMGHRRPELTSKPLRFFVVHEFVIAYAPDERPLLILGIIHGRRNPRVLAAILRGRDAEP